LTGHLNCKYQKPRVPEKGISFFLEFLLLSLYSSIFTLLLLGFNSLITNWLNQYDTDTNKTKMAAITNKNRSCDSHYCWLLHKTIRKASHKTVNQKALPWMSRLFLTSRETRLAKQLIFNDLHPLFIDIIINAFSLTEHYELQYPSYSSCKS
jgi:hypothetical protein